MRNRIKMLKETLGKIDEKNFKQVFQSTFDVEKNPIWKKYSNKIEKIANEMKKSYPKYKEALEFFEKLNLKKTGVSFYDVLAITIDEILKDKLNSHHQIKDYFLDSEKWLNLSVNAGKFDVLWLEFVLYIQKILFEKYEEIVGTEMDSEWFDMLIDENYFKILEKFGFKYKWTLIELFSRVTEQI